MDRWAERLGGPRGDGRGRPRQAPVPALRRRPHAPLAPAHGRRLGRLPKGRALASRPRRAWLVIQHRRARGGPVRRPRARADDGGADPLRPAPGRRSGRTCWPRSSTAAAFLRRLRAEAQTRQSATRCSTSGTSRASATCGRRRAASSAGVNPWRAAVGGARRAGAERRPGPVRPLMQASRRRGRQARDALGVRAAGCPAAAAARRSASAGRATTTAPPTGARSARRDPRRPQGRRRTWRPATRSRASRPRWSTGVDMIEFDVLRTRDGRLVLAHDYEDAAAREPPDAGGGARPLRRRGVRGRRARRGPEAARATSARWPRGWPSAGWSSGRWCPRPT